MGGRRKGVGAGLAVLLTAGLAACAPPQRSTPAATAPAASVQGSGMAGMDHQAVMAHCAQMQQQVRQGTPLSPDMQRMMASCQHMDHSMSGGSSGRSTRP